MNCGNTKNPQKIPRPHFAEEGAVDRRRSLAKMNTFLVNGGSCDDDDDDDDDDDSNSYYHCIQYGRLLAVDQGDRCGIGGWRAVKYGDEEKCN